MSDYQKIISLRSAGSAAHSSKLREDHRSLVSACRAEVASSLSTLLAGLFEAIDEALQDLVEKTAGSIQHDEYFAAVREVRIRRAAIRNGMRNRLLDGFDRFWSSGSIGTETEEEEAELKLLENDELDEMLAINGLIAKYERRYEKELYALDRRFAFMLRITGVNNTNNPLGPAALGKAFTQALGNADISVRVKLLVYRQFDKQVMAYVGGLYDELNSRLDHAGILPGITPKYRVNPVAPTRDGAETPQARAPSGPPPEPGRPAAAPDSASGGAFARLQDLLHKQRGRDAAVATASGAALPLDERDLIEALSQLQRDDTARRLYSRDLGSAPASDLRSELESYVGRGRPEEQPRSFRESDLDAIDVVGMLFEFLLQKKNLPNAMKALLARLQIPILKVAILDPGFFRNPRHPARRVLNRMTQLAYTWTDDGDRSEASLYGFLEAVVNRILSNFDRDVRVFEDIESQLETYAAREQQVAEMAEERTRRVSRGQEQLRAAKSEVGRVLNQRLDGRAELPEVVRFLLEDVWKDVLLLAYLRQGPESQAWKDALGVMDELIWSVEELAATERQELLVRIPGLLSNIRKGLTGISFELNKMAKIFKDLQVVHLQRLHGGGVSPESVPSQPGAREARRDVRGSDIAAVEGEKVTEGGAADEAEGDRLQRAPADEYTAIAESLPLGAWVEIIEANGTHTRAKLSWKSPTGDVFVFVNRKGLKVAEINAHSLASLLRRGRAELLDDPQVPVVERALALMMEKLSDEQVRSRH